MAKQTFTTGQVLTAAQMTSLQQTAMGGGSTTAKTASYVLVAADAGTVVQMNSAGATTITVNTALFAAGDSVQIQNIGAGVCTITAGTATVSTAGSLALGQYEGGQLYFNTTSAALFFDTVQASGSTSKVVQIVTATTNTQVSIATTTFTDTGLTATITPTSASNKVLVFISQNGLGKTGSTTMGYDYKLLRGATNVAFPVYSGGIVRTIDEVYTFSMSGTYLDAPATTSATTYKTQFRGTAATFACHAQYYNPDSSIVLMEVTP